ncbi:hypothetical protein [Reichenbachiella sp.]|uniref:hypothetical protein n=1 Tax=Reichenbachiella sp. TaxID=2184521 RepID=UPI003BB10B8C
MSDKTKDQISDWLNKLERESWQLELLVSAFTIFLLIQATISFEGFITELEYQYDLTSGQYSMLYLFIGLLFKSLEALTFFLVAHLMLRGFWIGTIGLRSVQSKINFSNLNYSDFFTEKLKKKVISLDQLVIKLDEICSVIFAFAFLVISILLAFGMYLIFFGMVAVILNALADISDWMDSVVTVLALTMLPLILITGLIYMIDYFTLGFFKKIKWFSKVYYPFYRLYNLVTLSVLSRSIYYYMISKFSKRKIRLVYGVAAFFLTFSLLFEFDQHPYYPDEAHELYMSSNHYDNLRPEDEFVYTASLESDIINQPFVKLFLRYDASDNAMIQSHCPDYVPEKEDGLNWKLDMVLDGGSLNINSRRNSPEEYTSILECLSNLFQVSINDSIYQDLSFRFYNHPSKNQKGLITVIPTNQFTIGENILDIKKVRLDSVQNKKLYDLATIPFWFSKP